MLVHKCVGYYSAILTKRKNRRKGEKERTLKVTQYSLYIVFTHCIFFNMINTLIGKEILPSNLHTIVLHLFFTHTPNSHHYIHRDRKIKREKGAKIVRIGGKQWLLL